MFNLALIIGLYTYAIFVVGAIGRLNFANIFLISIIFITVFLFHLTKIVTPVLKSASVFSLSEKLLAIIILLLILVNLVGALGPELSFDALWYHLTIPKEFILSHKIFYIQGNLLYYSSMPLLTEMLYIPALIFKGEILAKLIHFSFGLLTCIVIYKLARLYVSKYYSLLAVVIFYSNLVIGWLSITAFADLSRTFFEILSFYLFIKFVKTQNKSFLYKSAIILGFAIGAKLVSLTSIIIFSLLFIFILENKISVKLKQLLYFVLISLFVSMPWFLFAVLNTGNPIFPLFSKYYIPPIPMDLLSPIFFVKSLIEQFIFSPDPINPIYAIIFPLLIFNIKSIYKKYKPLLLYSVISIGVWYITPNTGGGRFIASYLPAYSVLTVITLAYASKNLKKIIIFAILLLAFITIFYRGIANYKFLSAVTGNTTKEEFLMNNLNFEFGDFYDENHDIQKIVENNKVLLIGMHNLYYVNFPHVDNSWDRGGTYKYILVQNQMLPDKYVPEYKQTYYNKGTHVKLYKLNEKDN